MAGEAIDVLAVMDRHEHNERCVYLDQLAKYGHIPGLAADLAKIEARLNEAREARATVADMIERERVMHEALTSIAGNTVASAYMALELAQQARAALARIGGEA